MSPRRARRGYALAAAATGALALVVVGSGVANAGTNCGGTATVTSGQNTIWMTKAYINNMGANHITMQAVNSNPVTDQGTYTTTTWTQTSGAANLKACTGTIHFGGGTLVTNTDTGMRILLDDIRWDVANNTIDYTVQTPAGAQTIVAMDLAGYQGGYVSGDHSNYGASAIYLDATARQTLNAVMGTTAFDDTELFGWFNSSVYMSQGTSPAYVHCG